jgi:hypothetical protein
VKEAAMGPIFVRYVRPDADVWPGRRLLAVLDAVAWPALWLYAIWRVPFETGLAGKALATVVAVVAIRRVLRAWVRNERYWFSTWRWGRFVLALIAVGCAPRLGSQPICIALDGAHDPMQRRRPESLDNFPGHHFA